VTTSKYWYGEEPEYYWYKNKDQYSLYLMSNAIIKHFTDMTGMCYHVIHINEEQMVFVLMKFKGLEDKFNIPFGKRTVYYSDWWDLYER
jgi:hypothetical protein